MTSDRDPFTDRLGPRPRYGPQPGYGPQAWYGPQPAPSADPAPWGAGAPGPGPAPTPHGTLRFGPPVESPGPRSGPAAPLAPASWSPSADDVFHQPAPMPGSSTAVDAPVRRGRARRGQALSWLAVSLAVLGAVALGGCLYLGLATVRLSSAEPVATALDWLAASGVAAGTALFALVLAVCALVVSRPRYVAALATGLALALPPVAVYLAVSAGLAVATRNVAADGTELVTLVSGALDQLGVEAGPVRGVLEWLGTWAAGWALGSE